MISFGKNIQKRRINLGLDTNDLAKLANYPNRSYIEKIESDKMYPSTKKIPDIAKALSCNIEDLFKNIEFEDEENDFIFIKKILKSIKTFEENKYPKRNLAFSLDICKKHYFCLLYFFEEKEYEICLIGLCDFLENILNLKEKRKSKKMKKDKSNDDVIILDDFLRI